MPALAAEWSYIDHSPSSYTSARPTDYVQSKFLTSATNNSAISSGSTSVARNRPDRNDGLPPAKVSLFNEAKLKMKWPEKRVVGAGLINLGNTCFVNSVLQCLSYTVPLSCHLLSGSHKSSCKEVGFCMLCLLQDHVTRSAFHQGDAFKPLKVLQNLRNIAKCLTWGRQEDAHEFLRYVVDSMQKSCLSGLNGLDKYSKETTLVHRIFGGYLRSQVMCMQCRHASNTFDPFLDISVEVKESSNLENALSKFVTPETLDVENAYKCESCMKKVCAQKRFTIHKASNVLTIHLKRFDMNRMLGTKVSRHIKFPSELNIRPYMSVSTGIPVYYSLYGVLVHSGFSCNSGHYYSYIKAPDDSWYCMNDSTVSKTSQSTVLGAEAYILFYGRLENKTVYVNGKAPCTITRYDTKSSCHTSSNGKVMIGPQLPARNFPPKSLICKVNKPAAVVVNTGLQSLVPYPEERDSPEREDASNEMNAPSHKVDKDIMQPAPSSKLNSFSNSSLKFTPRSVEPAAKLKVIPETPAAKSIPDVTTSHLAPIEMVHNDFSQKSDGTTLMSTDVVSPSCSNHKTQTVSNGAYRINPKNSFHQNDILVEQKTEELEQIENNVGSVRNDIDNHTSKYVQSEEYGNGRHNDENVKKLALFKFNSAVTHRSYRAYKHTFSDKSKSDHSPTDTDLPENHSANSTNGALSVHHSTSLNHSISPQQCSRSQHSKSPRQRSRSRHRSRRRSRSQHSRSQQRSRSQHSRSGRRSLSQHSRSRRRSRSRHSRSRRRSRSQHSRSHEHRSEQYSRSPRRRSRSQRSSRSPQKRHGRSPQSSRSYKQHNRSSQHYGHSYREHRHGKRRYVDHTRHKDAYSHKERPYYESYRTGMRDCSLQYKDHHRRSKDHEDGKFYKSHLVNGKGDSNSW